MLSNFIELFKEMKTLPGLRFKDDEQIFWLYSTLPETWANIIVLKAEDVSLDRLRDEMAELAACAGSFKVYCYPNSNLKAQEFLTAQGFQKALSPHLTKKLLKPENIDLRDGLLVKRVDNPDDYEGFLNVFQKSFGMKDETIRKIRQWQHMDGFTEDSCHKNFVAFKDDQIVGCASHYIRDGYCGFYNVGVLDSHRRQGIGRRVTQFALNDAFHRGARECGCYSSDMALNVYKGIGLTPGDDLLGFYK